MSTEIANPGSGNTRRWPRHQVELPIRIAVQPTEPEVPGLATEISRCGMAFYAGVPLQPGDPMEVEFQTPSRTRVSGVVRNRTGYCFGVEFLSRVPGAKTPAVSPSLPVPAACNPTAAEQAESAASYAAICAELSRAEDKLAILLQHKLDAGVAQDDPEFGRICAKLLRIRDLRCQIEALTATA